MKHLLLVPALIGLLTACSHHSKDPAKRAEKMENKITKELNLNDDQQSKLHAVFVAKQQMMEANKPKMMEMKREMQALITAPKLDRAKFKALMERKEAMKEEKGDDFLAQVYPKLEIFHESLTLDQRQKAAECLDKHKHGMY